MADISEKWEMLPNPGRAGARSEIHIVVMQNVNRIVTEPQHGASFLCILVIPAYSCWVLEWHKSLLQVIADWDDWGECSVLPACFWQLKGLVETCAHRQLSDCTDLCRLVLAGILWWGAEAAFKKDSARIWSWRDASASVQPSSLHWIEYSPGRSLWPMAAYGAVHDSRAFAGFSEWPSSLKHQSSHMTWHLKDPVLSLSFFAAHRGCS